MMQKWKGFQFLSFCYKTAEFIAFAKDLKKYIKNNLPPDSELVTWNVGHFDISGFIEQGEKYVYFSIGDVRFGDWYNNVLIRVAAHPKDYTGGINNFVNLDFFMPSIQTLLNKAARTA